MGNSKKKTQGKNIRGEKEIPILNQIILANGMQGREDCGCIILQLKLGLNTGKMTTAMSASTRLFPVILNKHNNHCRTSRFTTAIAPFPPRTSTLPATTAAGYLGFTMDPGGSTSVMGLRQPAFKGMASSTKVRKTYKTAACTKRRRTKKEAGAWKRENIHGMKYRSKHKSCADDKSNDKRNARSLSYKEEERENPRIEPNLRDGDGSIEIGGLLRRCASEVNQRRPAWTVDRDLFVVEESKGWETLKEFATFGNEVLKTEYRKE